MTRRRIIMNRISAILLLGLLSAAPSAGADVTYEDHVRPILKAACVECHGESAEPAGGLDLRLRHLAVKGGSQGPAIVPGKADMSVLMKRITSGEMPPGKKKLTPAQVDTLRQWIAAGANVREVEPESVAPGLLITAADRAFWFFQQVKKPAIPQFAPADRVRNPVDALLLAKLHEKKLAFSPEADRRMLIRRVTFDLIGLPPTPDEIEAFVKETSRDAYEKLIDRLLASPLYGERWGRHWLDVAGYADSEGYGQDDTVRTNAWRYRDYVIRSFNEDRPVDRFIHEQLAGDELIENRNDYTPADIDRLTATGFLRMAPDGTGQPNVEQKAARNQVITDTLKIVSAAFLGLTVNCAQCHHHRYDPIPQDDYYRLRALIEPAYNLENWVTPAKRDLTLLTTTQRAETKRLDAQITKIDTERVRLQKLQNDDVSKKLIAALPEAKQGPARKTVGVPVNRQTAEMKALLKEYPDLAMTPEVLARVDTERQAEITKLVKESGELKAKKPKEVFVRGLTEVPGQVPVTYLHHRGDYDQPKQAVPPGGLTILDARFPLMPPVKSGLPTTGRRLAFARWLTDPTNPMTARVLVNRVWLHHFGRGIVGTPGDFGKLGDRPTHPELLDWLAAEFVESGWSMKKLHRTMLLSTAYRQQSTRDAERDRIDPDNHFYSRMSVRRLEAESVRDSMIFTTGRLADKHFGPPVPVKDTEAGQFILGIENKDGAGRFLAEMPLPAGEEYRRSVYVQVRRSKPYYVLDAFDAPAVEPVCEVRSSSTVTPQALLLMNSDFVLQQAHAFAERLEKAAGTDPSDRVRLGFRLALGRDATLREMLAATAFLQMQTKALEGKLMPPANAAKIPTVPVPASPAQAALANWCQALLSSNEFLYVD